MGYDVRKAIAHLQSFLEHVSIDLDRYEAGEPDSYVVDPVHFQCEVEDVLHRQWKPAARKAASLIDGGATREEVEAALEELRAEGGEIEAVRLDTFDFLNRD